LPRGCWRRLLDHNLVGLAAYLLGSPLPDRQPLKEPGDPLLRWPALFLGRWLVKVSPVGGQSGLGRGSEGQLAIRLANRGQARLELRSTVRDLDREPVPAVLHLDLDPLAPQL